MPSEERQRLGPDAWLLPRFALAAAPSLLSELEAIIGQAPFRHMVTPGGARMSAALTNCGRLGWTSDLRGYRYRSDDPVSGLPWPDMPAVFLELAGCAAAEAGFKGFIPDACLINRYQPGARLSLHQDRDERDFSAPIVSLSLGLAARFLFGGQRRSDRPLQVLLEHGDVVVWGGVDRLAYHGVMPLKAAPEGLFERARQPLLDGVRINLTFRMAG